jgi:hypothetical protein
VKLGEYELNQIYTGDARELSKGIPDESVDLIFTDPVYWNPDDYVWLSQTAMRVLKEHGVALIWTGTTWERKSLASLEVGGLTYNITLNYIVNGNSAFANSLNLFMWRSPLLWMSKGKTQKPSAWIPDTIISQKPPANSFKWNKNPEAISRWLSAFEAQIVVDFFCGGGTVPVVCKQVKREFLAFEIDDKTAEEARQRVTQTPELLPFVYPDSYQGNLFDGMENAAEQAFAPDPKGRAENLVANN